MKAYPKEDEIELYKQKYEKRSKDQMTYFDSVAMKWYPIEDRHWAYKSMKKYFSLRYVTKKYRVTKNIDKKVLW